MELNKCPICHRNEAKIVENSDGVFYVQCMFCNKKGPIRQDEKYATIEWNKYSEYEYEKCPFCSYGISMLEKENDEYFEVKEKVSRKVDVYLELNDDAGLMQWHVVDNTDPGFWIDSFDTKKEAVDFCLENELKIVG